MTTKLILVRHGQTAHNVEGKMAGWTDSPLTALGRSQAEQVGRHVAEHYRLHRIYSSPLQRARHTAEALGHRIHIRPILRDDLKEINFGKFESLTRAEVSSLYPELLAGQSSDDPVFVYPEGESNFAFGERVRQAFAEIVSGNEDRTVAIVAHGGVLGAYIADLKSGEPHLWRQHVQRNCAITEIEIDGDLAIITGFDAVGHLETAREIVAPPLTAPTLAAAEGS